MSTTNVRHHRRRRAAWGFAAGVAVATTALGATTTHAQSNEVIKIGLIQTSEGPFANNSGTAAQGAQYAVDLINAAGGVNGRTLELVTADSHGQPEQLATIIPRFVSEENVIAMIGGVESASCDVGCPLAAQFETIYVSPGAARPGVLEPGRPYSFSLAQPDAANSTPALEGIVAATGITTAAIVVDEAFPTTVAQAALFRNAFELSGVEVVTEVTYSSGDASFAAQVTQIAAADVDAVALAAGPADAGRLAVEIDAQGLDVQLLGTGSLQSDVAGYIAAAGDAADGTLMAAQYNPHSQDPVASALLAQAAEEFGFAEVPLNFAYAFDAIHIMAQIIEERGLTGSAETIAADRVAMQEGFNELEGFVGMAEGTTFGDDGFSLRPILVAEVVDGVPVIGAVEDLESRAA